MCWDPFSRGKTIWQFLNEQNDYTANREKTQPVMTLLHLQKKFTNLHDQFIMEHFLIFLKQCLSLFLKKKKMNKKQYVQFWQRAVTLKGRRLGSLLKFHIKPQRVSKKRTQITHTVSKFKNYGWVLLTFPIQVQRGLSLKEYIKCAGFIFLKSGLS